MVMFKQEVWTGEEREGEEDDDALGVGEELGEEEGEVRAGGEDEMVRQTWYSVAGRR